MKQRQRFSRLIDWWEDSRSSVVVRMALWFGVSGYLSYRWFGPDLIPVVAMVFVATFILVVLVMPPYP